MIINFSGKAEEKCDAWSDEKIVFGMFRLFHRITHGKYSVFVIGDVGYSPFMGLPHLRFFGVVGTVP